MSRWLVFDICDPYHNAEVKIGEGFVSSLHAEVEIGEGLVSGLDGVVCAVSVRKPATNMTYATNMTCANNTTVTTGVWFTHIHSNQHDIQCHVGWK